MYQAQKSKKKSWYNRFFWWCGFPTKNFPERGGSFESKAQKNYNHQQVNDWLIIKLSLEETSKPYCLLSSLIVHSTKSYTSRLSKVTSGVWSVPLARGLVPTLLRLPEAPNGCCHEAQRRRRDWRSTVHIGVKNFLRKHYLGF